MTVNSEKIKQRTMNATGNRMHDHRRRIEIFGRTTRKVKVDF